MADVSQITPSSAQQPTQAVTPQPQALQGAIQTISLQAPPPVGSILSGFVVNRDNSGNPIVRTPNGDVAFSNTGVFLKIGSEVSLRIGGGSNNPQATLVSINGQPASAAVAQPAASESDVIVSGNLESNPATATQTTASDAPNSTPLISVTGTVLSSPQPNNAAALPAGTQLSLNLTSLTPGAPASAAPGASSSATPANVNPAQYAAYARAAGAPAPTANATPQAQEAELPSAPVEIPPGTSTAPLPGAANQPATAAIISAGLPDDADADTGTPALPAASLAGDANPPAAAPTQTIRAATFGQTAIATQVSLPPVVGQALEATVIATPPSGEAIVQTPLGPIQLQAGIALSPGTALTFEIASIVLPGQSLADAAQPAIAASEPAPVTELARQWTALQQIFSLLAQKSADNGENFANTSMPWLLADNPSAAGAALPQQPIAPGLLLFIQALQGGDFTGWIGKANAQYLEDEGHDALLKKAEGEFTSLSRQITDAPAPHQWQSLFFPVAVAGHVQQARLFVKRDRRQANAEDQENGEEESRFVMEVGLSQLGEMQMDGFVRKQAQSTQFDLIIRSQLPLSPEMQSDILQIYTSAGELTGYKGSLSFQTVKEFPVTPMDEVPHDASGIMI